MAFYAVYSDFNFSFSTSLRSSPPSNPPKSTFFLSLTRKQTPNK